MPYSGSAQTQRAITIEFLQKRRLNAPAVWFRPQGWDPSASDALAETLETDLGMWDAASDRNLGVRLEGGYIEIRIKSGDDAFAHAFFLACEHLRIDARAAFGVNQISSVILNVAGAGEQQLWPRGFKDKRGHWTEVTPVISSLPTKSAKAVWGYSRPLPGSLLPDGIVAWRPKGKAAALDVLMGIEDLEPRALAPTTTPVIVRAIAYATLAYWIRVYLDGLTEWDSILTRRVGGLIARLVREGIAVNASGKSLDGLCWSPVDTPELALDLIAFLGRLGASADLKVAYLHGEACLARGQNDKVAGWDAVGGLFGTDGKQGVRRAFRAGLDLDIVERMSEQYIFDVSTQAYLDRDRLLKGLSWDVTHEGLMRKHLPDGVYVNRKKVNPFALYAASQFRTDVSVSDMFPGAEPGAILRCSPVHGLLGEDETQSDEYKVLNIYRGFAIKPAGTVSEQTMSKCVSMLDRMLGLLTRDNDAQMDWLKKFIAWTIQHPEIKQQVAPIIIGGQGIGKTLFGNTFMRALFGELAGQANAAGLENNFLITPFVGKLMVYIDEVKIGSAIAINEVKKLVRESIISGEFKFKDRKDYRIYARLILTANHADIGLNPEDASDRALFFIVSWTAENRHLSKHDFNVWAGTLKPFYAEFAEMLEKVDVRQHLMHYFTHYKCNRAELEDLTHSSRDDENVVKATMSKARLVARRIAASAQIVAGYDLTAWFTTHHLRAAILREDGQRSRVEMQNILEEFEQANLIEPARQGTGGYYKFKYGYGKTLIEMGKAHNMLLPPVWPTGPGDFDDNPVMSNVNPPPWRGLPIKGGDGRRRPFDYSRRDDDDYHDPEQ